LLISGVFSSLSNGLVIEKQRFFPSVLQSDKIKFKISLFCEIMRRYENCRFLALSEQPSIAAAKA